MTTPPVLVVMGVSGSGKTTVAEPLAEKLGWTFQEGDALHPAANIAKMKAGIPLDDADRAPWLAAIGTWMDGQIAQGMGGVVTCSALKRAYRDLLRAGRPLVRFVYLEGSEGLIAHRLAARSGHFMPPSLLASQFAALEPPAQEEHAIVVNIDQPVAAQVDRIFNALRAEGQIPAYHS